MENKTLRECSPLLALLTPFPKDSVTPAGESTSRSSPTSFLLLLEALNPSFSSF